MADSPQLAYLVIREGAKWTDVFRLVPGHQVTIGRASTNQIVVKNERASRSHAEIFMTAGQWVLRDLESRNGTTIGGVPAQGDVPLNPGDIVRIAHCQMAFVYNISQAFDELPIASLDEDTQSERTAIVESDSSCLSEVVEPTTITHRRHRTRYLGPVDDEELASPRIGKAAKQLCRLAFKLAQTGSVSAMAELALSGLFESTQVDAGAVMVGWNHHQNAEALEVLAKRSDTDEPYHRISEFLAETVLREGEAVLARNVADDSMLGGRDSQGLIHASSVICAPIRQDGEAIGLLHLYSSDDRRTPDPDDLEFTLAVADIVALALRNIERQEELVTNLSQTRREIVALRKRLGAESRIIGSSDQVKRLHQEIARAAPSRATVLIRGESGVGKELVARAVHYASPRKDGPFVCLNCAALSESLLESELFGHERGAFTGATERKVGKFEAADQGTLMLDEIGEMSPSIQAKFLRVLEGHPFERVGGNKAIKVDVRVIAATNRDLEQAVKEDKFRRDLYFRLHVVEMLVAPLRDRGDDVSELARYFLARFNSETGRRIRGFTAAAVKEMRRYHWPGNIRELKNVIERAVLLARGDRIEMEDLTLSSLETPDGPAPAPAPRPPGDGEPYESLSLAELERRHIRATLEATGWNKSRTAGVLGIERSTLDRKIRRYGLSDDVANAKRQQAS